MREHHERASFSQKVKLVIKEIEHSKAKGPFDFRHLFSCFTAQRTGIPGIIGFEMPVVQPEKLVKLQQAADGMRNVGKSCSSTFK